MFRYIMVAKAIVVVGTVIAASNAAAQSRNAPFILDGLVVTASPTPRAAASVAQHVTVLDGRELEHRGLTSLADALRDVSGVAVVRGGSFGAVTSLFLRGGESDYVLVMIDGVQVNQAGGGFDFASLTTLDVERVEIVRGPNSALYGSDAVAGVIHVITRSGRAGQRGALRFEVGSYRGPSGGVFDGTQLTANLSGASDRAGYSVALGRESADGTLPFNSGAENLTLSASGRFLPDDRTRVSLAVRRNDREHHYPTDGAGVAVDRNAFYFEDQSIVHLSAGRQLTPGVEVEALVAFAQNDAGTDDAPDDGGDADSFQSLDAFRRATAQVMAHVRRGGTVFTAGGEIEEERQRSFSESLSTFGAYYGRSESHRKNLAVFGHVTSERGPIAFALGGRVEDNQRFGTIATWQAGTSARIPGSEGTRARLSMGSAIKEPTFTENYATGFAVGNPDLDPERSLSWEIGLEQALADGRARFSATYFDQRFSELIQYTFLPPQPTDPNFFNVAEARARGLEVEGSGAVGPLLLGGAWTWLDTEVVDAGLDSGAGATFVAGERLLRRPRHAVSFSAEVPVGTKVRLRSRLGRAGARDDRNFSAFPATPVALDAYTVFALGAEWKVREATGGRPGFTVAIRGENLLDQTYQEAFGFDAPGRQIYMGGTVSFGGRP